MKLILKLTPHPGLVHAAIPIEYIVKGLKPVSNRLNDPFAALGGITVQFVVAVEMLNASGAWMGFDGVLLATRSMILKTP